MSSFLIYLYLECKKSLHLMKKMIISLCLLLLFVTAGIIIAAVAMTQANVLAKVQVAVVIPASEDQTRVVVQFASTLDSIQSICEFVYCDSEQEALHRMDNGEAQACIVFPDNFYEDADQGINTPATVYLRDTEVLSQRLFRGLLRDGVGLLQTAEAGVYAVLDVSEQYPVGLDREKIGDLMLDLYISQLFAGSKMFRETVVSPFDTYRLPEYVFGGLLFMTVLLPGLCFGCFYRPGQRALEQKLQISGIKAWKLSLSRVAAMTLMPWLCCLFMYVAGCVFTALSGCEVVYWHGESVAGIFLLCLAFACVFHGVYACSGNPQTGTVAALLLELWMMFGSGMLIPLAYLPETMQKISRFTQLEMWGTYLLKLLYQGFDWKAACTICLYAVVMFSLGVLFLWKRTLSGYRCS